MMKKRRLIPFSLLPASWGLAGPDRARAEAYYLYDGYELEIRLAELESATAKEIAARKLDIDFAHDRISAYEYTLQKKLLMCETDIDRQIAMIEANIEHNRVSAMAGEKEIATLRKEPWVTVVESGLVEHEVSNGWRMKLDWNEFFISELYEHGYRGDTEEEMVEQWFNRMVNSTRELDE